MENIFQRPPILMRLTMLTRDKMSLLRAASLRTARETAHGLNDRKHKGCVEAGILRLPASASPFSGRAPSLTLDPTQHYCSVGIMLPEFNRDGRLPPGIHWTTWQEIQSRFGFSSRRQQLLGGLRLALAALNRA